jgi:hypothetical protein
LTAAFVREAVYDGRRIAMLRCVDGPNGVTVVEAEIAPAGGGNPVRRGPYSFSSPQEAFRFVQETTLALQYLGCAVGPV